MILSRSHNAKAGPERFDGIIDAVLTTSQPIAVSEHYAKEGFEVTNVTATSVCVRGHNQYLSVYLRQKSITWMENQENMRI